MGHSAGKGVNPLGTRRFVSARIERCQRLWRRFVGNEPDLACVRSVATLESSGWSSQQRRDKGGPLLAAADTAVDTAWWIATDRGSVGRWVAGSALERGPS